MTVQEYNDIFLPKCDTASLLVSRLNDIVNHAEIGRVGHEEVIRTLEVYGYSDESKEFILKALEYYRQHEGIEKIDIN